MFVTNHLQKKFCDQSTFMYELSKSEGYIGNISKQSVGKKIVFAQFDRKKNSDYHRRPFLLKGNAYVHSFSIPHF